MMTDWYQKSINALALNGKAGRTQEAYSRALRMLCEFYGKVPEEIVETELETYFLHRRNVDRWSANTLRICYCGIRFYFVKVLQRDWNRHCPVCQQGKADAWLARQLERRLPTPYFMLTFTVPANMREFLRRHPREGYGALFAASAGAIKTLAADGKHLGADTPGFFGVLHTWGRQLA